MNANFLSEQIDLNRRDRLNGLLPDPLKKTVNDKLADFFM
jgi:hypothetical protein